MQVSLVFLLGLLASVAVILADADETRKERSIDLLEPIIKKALHIHGSEEDTSEESDEVPHARFFWHFKHKHHKKRPHCRRRKTTTTTTSTSTTSTTEPTSTSTTSTTQPTSTSTTSTTQPTSTSTSTTTTTTTAAPSGR